MIVNEVLQWAVLVFLAVLVVGLTRQLGFFLTPRAQQLEEMGPEPGRTLKPSVVTEAERDHLRDLMASRGERAALLAVVDERCRGCETFVHNLETGFRDDFKIPVALLVREGSPAYLARLRAAADLVIADPDDERSRAAGIVATPYALVVDAAMKVRARDVAGDMWRLVRPWARAARSGESAGLATDITPSLAALVAESRSHG